MKKIVFIPFLLCLFHLAISQNSRLIFYSEKGELFSLTFDKGNKQELASYYRRLDPISGGSHSFEIQVEGNKYPIRKTFVVKAGWEYTFIIRKRIDPFSLDFENMKLKDLSFQNFNVWAANGDFEVRQISGIKMQTTSVDAFTPAGTDNPNGQSVSYQNNAGYDYGSGNVNKTWTNPCSGFMEGSAFETTLVSLQNAGSEENRKTLAITFINQNCMNSMQVRRVLDTFPYEKEKIEVAKNAWHHTSDRENFYLIFDSMYERESISQLSAYMQANP